MLTAAVLAQADVVSPLHRRSGLAETALLTYHTVTVAFIHHAPHPLKAYDSVLVHPELFGHRYNPL